MVAMIAFPFMIVVTNQSKPVINIDQGILVAVGVLIVLGTS